MKNIRATEQPAWKQLAKLATAVPRIEQCLDDSGRNARLQLSAAGIAADFSKQRIDSACLEELLSLGRALALDEARDALLAGEPVNNSENRPALHTALRTPLGQGLAAYESDVHATLARALSIVDEFAEVRRHGATGKAITDVVHIGIGGSHLGPELAVQALPASGRFRVHFAANIDGHAMTQVLSNLDPERTVFVIVSKSFSTLETLSNANTARSWFLERGGQPADIARHFFAISANVDAAVEFGIAADNVLPMWDWVGGRYSVWSAVGIPIAFACGSETFRALLRGAHAMDQHFASAQMANNLPMLAALIGAWNTNFLGANSHAVLAYDERLTLLPLYLQQLETESNGKQVRRDGEPVDTHTMPILWGGVGTTGQHAYHQLLHQGTRAFSADFIFAAQPDHQLAEHHRWLVANALAQSQAMMIGDQPDQAERQVPGNHATTTYVVERLDATHLGALLALYEHKVFCQGVIWGINSFDQWGVELGKKLAGPIFNQLGGDSAVLQDASTKHLIKTLR